MEADKYIGATKLRISDTMLSDEIVKLHGLHLDGIISSEEFSMAKIRLLSISN
jgi:hypothetical protein